MAKNFPDTAELVGLYGGTLFQADSGPPDNRQFLSQSSYVADVRVAAFTQAWSESWLEPTGLLGVQIDALEYRRQSLQESAAVRCKPATPLNLAAPVKVAGLLDVGNRMGTVGCLEARRGRLSVEITVAYPALSKEKSVEGMLRALTTSLDGWMTVTPDQPAAAGGFSSTRNTILRSWMLALLTMAGLVVAPSLFDRGLWTRFTGPLRRHGSNRRQVDLSATASAVLARSRAVTALRFALLVWSLRVAEIAFWDSFVTLGGLIVAFVAGILLQRWIMAGALPFHRTRTYHGRALIPLAIGVAVTAVIAVLGGFIWLLGVDVRALPALSAETTEWQADRGGLLFLVGGGRGLGIDPARPGAHGRPARGAAAPSARGVASRTQQ